MLRLLPALAAALPGTQAAAVPARPDPAGEAALAKLVAGRVAGPPLDCVDVSMHPIVTLIAGTAIVYQEVGRTLYVNRPLDGAAQIEGDDIIVTHQQGAQLCRQDTVRLVARTSGTPHGVVYLGRFVPYTRAVR